MDNSKLEDYISKGIGQKMITPQECLQIKREMEAEHDTDFEASPLAICMMITLLLFGICLWIWLISWNCFFGQSLEKDVKKSEKNNRLSGGLSTRSQKKEVRLMDRCNKDRSDLSIRSQLLRNFNPLSDLDRISHPGSSRQGCQTSTPTGKNETQSSGSPTVYGTNASSLEEESPKAPKKYKIKWTKLFKLSRSEDSNN